MAAVAAVAVASFAPNHPSVHPSIAPTRQAVPPYGLPPSASRKAAPAFTYFPMAAARRAADSGGAIPLQCHSAARPDRPPPERHFHKSPIFPLCLSIRPVRRRPSNSPSSNPTGPMRFMTFNRLGIRNVCRRGSCVCPCSFYQTDRQTAFQELAGPNLDL